MELAERDDEVLEVTLPRGGDTIALGDSSGDVSVSIAWTVPSAIAERPAFISLKQGYQVSDLALIHVLSANATNNGSYTWYGDSYTDGLTAGYSYSLPSGCNYTMELKVWQDAVYSGYFTVINPEDGGLNTTSVCPSAATRPGAANVTYPATGATSSDGTSSNGTSNADGGGGAGVSGTGSPSKFIIAIVIPIVVLLATFGLVIWLGIRKGWFVKASQRRDRSKGEYEASGTAATTRGGKAGTVAGSQEVHGMSELHDESRPHQLGGNVVYQLHGDEERARFQA